MQYNELDSDARGEMVFGHISRETAERRTRLRNERHKAEDAEELLRILRKRRKVTKEAEILLRTYPHLQREFQDLIDRIQAD